MAAPSNTPTPASTLRVNPKGSMTKQVTATTIRKRRRTRMISTVNLPADASCLYAHTTRRCTRASPSPRDKTGRSLRMRGAHELGDECAPRPGLVGLSRASVNLRQKYIPPVPVAANCFSERSGWLALSFENLGLFLFSLNSIPRTVHSVPPLGKTPEAEMRAPGHLTVVVLRTAPSKAVRPIIRHY